jgi:preprotein translocase subunit SecA
MENERKVKEAGGLHVLGSERHESRRIDNQLRGRAARQGDAGSSQFFLSLEDELMRLFGGTGVSALMQRLNMDDAMPIAHGMVDRTIEQVQSRVEGANFDSRKHLLEYDDVLNQQREVYYGQRNRVFEKEDLGEDLAQMLDVEVERRVQVSQSDPEGGWKLLAWLEETQPTLGGETNEPFPSFLLRLLLEHLEDRDDGSTVRAGLLEIAQGSLAAQGEHLRATVEEQLEHASERHKELVRQRLDLADTAVEGAIAEAEETGSPIDPRALLATVEQTAGVRIQMDATSSEALRRDPTSIRRVLPQLLEASVGLRIWTGMVAWIENRIGESLGLAANPPEGGWEAAAEAIRESFQKIWDEKVERSLSELRTELGNALPDSTKVESAQKLRLLLQMSYTQRTLFDRKTHQRRSLLVARLMYPYYAARFLEDLPAETLRQRVLDHLETGQDAIYLAVGKAELLRLGDQAIGSLDETLRTRLFQELGEARLAEVAGRAAVDLREDPDVTRAVGRAALTGAYRSLILSVGDRLWVEYLTQMEALRTSIGLEAYGQRDPLVQYKSRAFDMFQQLLGEIRAGVVSRMFRFQVRSANNQGVGTGAEPPVPAGPLSHPAESEEDEAGAKRKRRRRHR